MNKATDMLPLLKNRQIIKWNSYENLHAVDVRQNYSHPGHK